jgi:hypothetical protein
MTQKQDCRFVHLPGSGNRGGRTVAYLREKDRIVVGVAYCHINDTYNKKEGTSRAYDRVMDVLRYGTNGTKENLPVLRDSVTQKVSGFTLDGAIMRSIAVSAIAAALRDKAIQAITTAVAGVEADIILGNMYKSIKINDLDSVSHIAVESVIKSIVVRLR